MKKIIYLMIITIFTMLLIGCGTAGKEVLPDDPPLDNPSDPTPNATKSWKLLGSSSAESGAFTDMLVVSPDVYLAYYDEDNHKILVKKFVNGLWNNYGSALNSGSSSSFINLSMVSNNINISYINDDNMQKVNTFKYSSDWEVVTTKDFSSNFAWDVDMAQVTESHYLVYCDGSSGTFNVTVNVLSSGNWQSLSPGSISAGEVKQAEIVSFEDKPCIAYTDEAYGRDLIVKQFDGAFWNMVGGTRVTDHEVRDVTMLEYNGALYVSYVEDEGTYIDRASVIKYESGSWSYVGSRAIVDVGNGSAKLALSGNTPYLAFNDVASSNMLSVIKNVGSDWQYVGSRGISSGNVSYIDIEGYDSNVAVSFVDSDNKVKVVTYR